MRRAAIIDLDVHQGNGNNAIFAGDESVFTFSMHGSRNYPFHKVAGSLDVELADEASNPWDGWLTAAPFTVEPTGTYSSLEKA